MRYSDIVQIGEKLVWRSPHTGDDTTGTFRGKSGGKFTLFLDYLHVDADPADCRRASDPEPVAGES